MPWPINNSAIFRAQLACPGVAERTRTSGQAVTQRKPIGCAPRHIGHYKMTDTGMMALPVEVVVSEMHFQLQFPQRRSFLKDDDEPADEIIMQVRLELRSQLGLLVQAILPSRQRGPSSVVFRTDR
jgi:hypothetical protein